MDNKVTFLETSIKEITGMLDDLTLTLKQLVERLSQRERKQETQIAPSLKETLGEGVHHTRTPLS